jgi:hypothetical protein
MLLRPRKHPHLADDPVSPADIAESLLAMGIMAWMIAPTPFLWAPPLWTLALMAPVGRPADPKAAPPAREERASPAVAQQPPLEPLPAVAAPVQAPPQPLPRAARTPRPRQRPRRKEPR